MASLDMCAAAGSYEMAEARCREVALTAAMHGELCNQKLERPNEDLGTVAGSDRSLH